MLVVAVELVSGLLSLASGFPLCSLMPVLSKPHRWPLLARLSSLRPPGQMSAVSAKWNQTEHEGDLLGPVPGIPQLPQSLCVSISSPETLPALEAWRICRFSRI